ncbi:MAG: HD domain-containing protein [Candidatus Peribacteraceae bacterium]|nr:HD domain-containing protein [Candidatus Peribacteraceae bacterium]
MIKILNREDDVDVAALCIMMSAHAGQKTRDGGPYQLHPIAVAEFIDPLMIHKKLRAVAYLHDVIEDTDWTSVDLLMAGISVEIVAAVVALTKVKGESYDAYIKRVMSNYFATLVKIADMTHNMDITRLPMIRVKDAARNRKYRKYRKILRAHARNM